MISDAEEGRNGSLTHCGVVVGKNLAKLAMTFLSVAIRRGIAPALSRRHDQSFCGLDLERIRSLLAEHFRMLGKYGNELTGDSVRRIKQVAAI